MPTRAIKTNRNAVIRQIERESLKNIKALADEVRASVVRDYGRTFKHWNESEQNKFPNPEDNLSVNQVIGFTKGKGHRVTLIFDLNNILWNWLDDGTPDIIQPTTSPPIPERVDVRTFTDELDVDPFPGFTGRFFRIAAGRVRRGIKGRRWTRRIGLNVREAQKDNPEFDITIDAKGESL